MTGSLPLLCFHCGERVPSHETRSITIDGKAQPLCCAGCEAVANLIINNGLENFYQFRNGIADKPKPAELQQEWQAYDKPDILNSISSSPNPNSKQEHTHSAIFLLENLYCGACAWLIKNTLSTYPGVKQVTVNPATHRMHLCWNQTQTPLSKLLQAVAALGYAPHPSSDTQAQTIYLQEKRAAIKRLAVAGLGMMQVMMNAIALYLDIDQVMDIHLKRYLILINLLITTPVVFYAGKPFFTAAWRYLSQRRVGMDVPIALAIGSAYLASLWAALSGRGEIYFDSVCMFVFFLSLGRFAEMVVKHKLLYNQDAYSVLLPASATRIRDRKTFCLETVPLNQIRPGQYILIKTGEVIPCDGVLIANNEQALACIDESILSGESLPQPKQTGDKLIAGSINVAGNIQVRVTHTGQHTTLAHIKQLMDNARTQKPQMVYIADRIAGKFVLGVLSIATLVALYWWHTQATLAFPIALSVLVVTCPCALSLATPTALAAAATRMARSSLLLTRTDALERLNHIKHILLDKTGTLSHGRIQLHKTVALHTLSQTQCEHIAAALEQQSPHPIANAFSHIKPPLAAESVNTLPGLGIEGIINHTRYRIGSWEYIQQTLPGGETADNTEDHPKAMQLSVYLADQQHLLAEFICGDRLRKEAAAVVEQLQALPLQLHIASGDHMQAVQHVAGQLNIDHYQGRMSPQAKLNQLQTLQKQSMVAMVGDGINDAPILAAADVSFAMHQGSSLAQSQADIILLNNDLHGLLNAFSIARKTQSIIRQNIIWAIAYNVIAIPLAAGGLIAPWLAAVGMSCSSLLVVLNAMRITYFKTRNTSAKHSDLAYPINIKQNPNATA